MPVCVLRHMFESIKLFNISEKRPINGNYTFQYTRLGNSLAYSISYDENYYIKCVYDSQIIHNLSRLHFIFFLILFQF